MKAFEKFLVAIVVAIVIVVAAFARLFQFMTAPFRLRAVLAVAANGLVEVPFCLFDLAMAAIVITVQGLCWNCAAANEGYSKNQS